MVPITVTQATTKPTLTVGESEMASGASNVLTATMSETGWDSYTLTGAVPPTGTVTFKNGTTTLGTGTLSPQIVYSVGGPNGDSPEYTYASAASLTTTGITTTGSNSITAVYNGDTNNASETSSAVTVTVASGTATTTTLTSSANPTAVGAQPTLTATVSGAPTSGTVTFYDGTTVLGTTKLSRTGGGVAKYTSLGGTSASNSSKGTTSQPGLAVGTHSLTAVYSGLSTTSLASTSSALSQVITQASIDISLSTKTVGSASQKYIFSANLACDAAGCESDGSTPPNYSFPNYFPPVLSNVNFYDGSTLLGSAPAYTVSENDGGFGDWMAQFSATLSSGTHTITATYADTNYALSTSNAQTVTVGGTPTVTWAAPAAITYGTALSATQLDATSSIPGTFTYTPAAGTVLNVGSYTLSVTWKAADYTDYPTAITQTVPLTVNPAPATIAFSNLSQEYNETALSPTVTTTPAGLSYTSTGYPDTNVGSYPVTATITNTNYTAAPASGTFVITDSNTNVSVGSSASGAVAYGTSVTFTATIGSDNGAVKGRAKKHVKSHVLSGTLNWSVAGCSSSTISGEPPQTATCTTSSLAVGSDTVTANYLNDANHTNASGSATQQVNQASTTIDVTSVSPAAEDFAADQPVTITAVLAWTGGGTAPTGASDHRRQRQRCLQRHQLRSGQRDADHLHRHLHSHHADTPASLHGDGIIRGRYQLHARRIVRNQQLRDQRCELDGRCFQRESVVLRAVGHIHGENRRRERRRKGKPAKRGM